MEFVHESRWAQGILRLLLVVSSLGAIVFLILHQSPLLLILGPANAALGVMCLRAGTTPQIFTMAGVVAAMTLLMLGSG